MRRTRATMSCTKKIPTTASSDLLSRRSLVDSKAVLERTRSEAKRSWSMKLQEARTQLNKARDAVADSSEEVRSL